MAESNYPEEMHFAGLIQAATAAADEETPVATSLGKRKRDANDEDYDPELRSGSGAPASATDASSTPLQNSAAVLFREPSAKSKKHSRPPLGKVFTSLELAPETFLKLQTAAKTYMLDETHPERRDVVGHKKNVAGADLAKLNLFNCVEEFLSVQGYGEVYFGHNTGQHIPGAPVRTMFWPEDSQAIIKLMMPLMRKMVTNERQRIYAAASRKQGPAKENNDDSTLGVVDPNVLADSNLAPTPSAEAVNGEAQPTPAKQPAMSAPAILNPEDTTATKPGARLLVNIVTAGEDGQARRVAPRFDIGVEAAQNLTTLISEVEKRYPLNLTNGVLPVVRVLTVDGLVAIAQDGEWAICILGASFMEWMDGEIRVLVYV
jgi:hypothetical protein